MDDDPEDGMSLSELHGQGVEGRLVLGSLDPRVTGVQHDSRRVSPGDLFVAVRGENHDGARFVGDAIAKGAVGVIAEHPLDRPVPQLVVDDARIALAKAAELVYGNPTSRLRTAAITGTNGKTTTAHLLATAIEASSAKVALIGTTGLFVGEREISATHTTPEGDDISRFARQALAAGASHLVLEASSHGLALHRIDALDLDVAAFTNLSRDHLDFHGTLEAYGEAKARLFCELEPKQAVVHIDDPFGAELARRASTPLIRCSRDPESEAEIRVITSKSTRRGIEAHIETPDGSVELRSPMLGEHNLENMLVALGCVHALGLDVAKAIDAWRTVHPTPGRLERVEHPGDVAVLVDYAHTPAALGRVLDTMAGITPGRVIVVFGAGCDRDRGKRPEMGRRAAQHADLCVLTSDNPRNENPEAILDEVEAGLRDAGMEAVEPAQLREARQAYCRLADRREAIGAAVEAARSGDSVLIAGKGHETTQIIAGQRTHFDDREEARAAIATLRGGA